MTTLRFLLILLLVLNALAFAAVQGWLGSAAPRGEPQRLASQLNPERIRLAADPAATPPASVARPPVAVEPAAPLEPAEPVEPAESAAPAEADDAPARAASTTTAQEPAEVPPPLPEGSDAGAALGSASTRPEDAAGGPGQDAPSPPAAVTAAPPPAAPVVLDCFAWEGLSATGAEQLTQRLAGAGFSPTRSRVDTPNSWWVRVPPQASREQAERRVQELRQLGVKDTYIVPDAGPTQFAISLGVFKTENRARQLLNQLREQGVRNAGAEPRLTTTYRVQASLPAERLRSIEAVQGGLRARRAACTRGG